MPTITRLDADGNVVDKFGGETNDRVKQVFAQIVTGELWDEFESLHDFYLDAEEAVRAAGGSVIWEQAQ